MRKIGIVMPILGQNRAILTKFCCKSPTDANFKTQTTLKISLTNNKSL